MNPSHGGKDEPENNPKAKNTGEDISGKQGGNDLLPVIANENSVHPSTPPSPESAIPQPQTLRTAYVVIFFKVRRQ